jgi:formylglycine-generating enzyme required for sulfatase activity/predicted Ser/Thr protein kinase
MGAVYLAEQVNVAFSRPVVLKVLRRELSADDQFVRRFQREAMLAAKISHRHVTTILDCDQAEDGSLFIVMEHLEGKTLSEVVRQEGALDVKRALRLGTQIAEGLKAVHDAGIVHRDVKPQNIMVLGADDHVKLMDFGIARLRDQEGTQLTRTGVVMGSPAFMAPEQFQDTDVDERADIYAFGVVLYEMLAGSLPFKGDTPAAVFAKKMDARPARLRAVRTAVPGAVESVVMQALEKDPRARQQNIGEALEALRQAERQGDGAAQSTVVPSPAVNVEVDRARGTHNAGRWWMFVGAGVLAVLVVVFVALWPPRSDPDRLRAIVEEKLKTAAANQRSDVMIDVEPLRDDGVEMVLVPVGEFWMGSSAAEVERAKGDCKKRGNSEPQCKDLLERELPRHRVSLDAFHIDRHEVTNALFERFVRATKYQTTAEREGSGFARQEKDGNSQWVQVDGAQWRRPSGPGSSAELNHPVVQVSWDDASAYCRWVGKRLPTEAEWEKAARGADGRRYPWGEDWGNSKANGDMTVKGTRPVGSYAGGVSPYGLYDMAGNVAEWVADWFGATYYQRGSGRNPAGPESGEFRVMRGGSWYGNPILLRSAYRIDGPPDWRSFNLGFRCARGLGRQDMQRF